MNNDLDFRKYNHELYELFTETQEKNIANAQAEIKKKKGIFDSLDLFRAISTYRKQPHIHLFFLEHPEMEPHGHNVELLWDHFSKLTKEELANLAIETIHEISDFVDSHPSSGEFDSQEEWQNHIKKFN